MNYYDILGVKKTASQEEIKAAYKNLVKKYHPDIYKGDKTFAEKKTASINGAYDVLSNPETRKAYDDEISPKAEYSYTPPEYTKTYNEYKNNYTSYHHSNVNDGSEHDYSTYANYSRYYNHYQNSKTQNSDYTYNDNSFSGKFVKTFDKMSTKNKLIVFIVCFILYIIIFTSFFIQLGKFNTQDDTTYSKPEITVQNRAPANTIPSNIPSNSNTNTSNNIPSNSDTNASNNIPENSIIPDNTTSVYNIYDFFTEEELQQLYTQFQSMVNYNITYEEFKEALTEYINTGYQY